MSELDETKARVADLEDALRRIERLLSLAQRDGWRSACGLARDAVEEGS